MRLFTIRTFVYGTFIINTSIIADVPFFVKYQKRISKKKNSFQGAWYSYCSFSDPGKTPGWCTPDGVMHQVLPCGRVQGLVGLEYPVLQGPADGIIRIHGDGARSGPDGISAR